MDRKGCFKTQVVYRHPAILSDAAMQEDLINKLREKFVQWFADVFIGASLINYSVTFGPLQIKKHVDPYSASVVFTAESHYEIGE